MFGSVGSRHGGGNSLPSSHHRHHQHHHHVGSSGSSSHYPMRTLKSFKKRSARKSLYFTSSKLSLVNNPVKQDTGESGLEEQTVFGDGHSQHHSQHHWSQYGRGDVDEPPQDHSSEKESPLEFHRKESASMSELFYDLWFVANLNVFTTVHPITEADTLASFVGYFLLLWITWFITTVFDARFGQDGILERIARACHLAVMVGFAFVGISFSEDELIKPIFQATSFFLMMSRLVLAAQYGLVLFHARHHRRSRNSLALAIALHLLPAFMYLVVAIVSSNVQDKRLFWLWYIGGLIEMGAIIMHATFSKTLSFEGTHFNERLNLLTLIILGEGVIILTKNITKIVEYTFIKHAASSWSPALVGVNICSAANLYITFLLYFDWMHFHRCMKAVHQAYWAVIHLPFHIALVLLSEGSSQWDVWWRAIEAYRDAKEKLKEVIEDTADDTESTSSVVAALRDKAFEILEKYGADTDEGGPDMRSLNTAFSTLSKIPDQFWDEGMEDHSDPNYSNFVEGSTTVLSTVMNAINDAFDISVDDNAKTVAPTEWDTAETEALKRTTQRLVLILVYLFLSAGLVLILLILMHILSKRRGWSYFNIFRASTAFVVGVGLSLVALIGTNAELADRFLETPWQLPTITICYFSILALTHLPHPPRIFFKNPSPAPDPESAAQSAPQSAPEQNNTREVPILRIPQPPRLREDTPENTQRHSRIVGNRLSQATSERSLTLRRGLSRMKNIRVERGQADPVAEVDDIYTSHSPMDRSPLTPIRISGLYRV